MPASDPLPAVLVEVVGPAGAGKTTVARALAERCSDVHVGIPLSRAELLRAYVGPAAGLLATYVRRFRGTPWFTKGESRGIAYLGAWQRQFTRGRLARGRLARGRPRGVHVLDHGPIYRLVRLAEFGPPLTSSVAFRRWWETVLARWASTLDVVVWLDASDDVLLARIRSRQRGHAVREVSTVEALAFLARYRAGFDAVLARLAADPRVCLLRFDTAATTPGQVADEVLTAVHRTIPDGLADGLPDGLADGLPDGFPDG